MKNINIKCLNSQIFESGSCYGKFVINSLPIGQGITIGNTLRRVLLADLTGTAISAVKIIGVNNEFTIIPGLREDVLEFLLNLQGIVFKSNITRKNTELVKLKVQGPLVITADSLQLPSNLEIVNKTHYLATITTSNSLQVEMKIERGTGYKLASQMSNEENTKFLQIDAIFMPVKKVNFTIENIYDSNNDITERLFLEIWTNGSISPIESIKKACSIIIELFEILNKNEDILTEEKSKFLPKKLSLEPYLEIPIEDLHLSVRSYNCLKKAKINTIGDILKYSPKKLQELRNFGKKSSDEVFSILKYRFGIVYQ